MPDQPGKLTRIEQLERLLEISRNLSSNLDLPSLLQNIVEVACQLTDSEGASILLYDAALGRLRFESIPAFQEVDLKGISVPVENSVAGWIFKNARPLIINQTQNDPRIYREVDRRVHFHTRSILGVPLLIKQEPIGVLEAVNKIGSGNYTEADLGTLDTLAGQAAIAIENARLLAKLQHANEELTRLDRMKSDFIAIASHELRTPLGLILGHATFLHELIGNDHRDQVEVIVRSAERLKSIVEDMSRITHKEEGRSRVHHQSFSISRLVQEMVERFAELAEEKGIEFGFDVPEGEPLEVEADREKIEVALSNLVRNALGFTDSGGQVGVKAEGSGDFVKVFVVDTGIGIPEEDMPRIFERFYRVDKARSRELGGTGLGLAIVKHIVHGHNGRLHVESTPGVGSTFSIMIPSVDKDRR